MKNRLSALVLLAASGSIYAADLCDDLSADDPPVEYAAMSAPVLQKAAPVAPASTTKEVAAPNLENRLGVNMPVPAGANPQ